MTGADSFLQLVAAAVAVAFLAAGPVAGDAPVEANTAAQAPPHAQGEDAAAPLPMISADDQGLLQVLRNGPMEPAGAAAGHGRAATAVGRSGHSSAFLSSDTDAAGSADAPAQPTPQPSPQPLPSPMVVVELFTSQGCTPCLPADMLVSDLLDHDGVLPLAFHVDYWDYLGWPDSFARPEFTARQKGYARGNGEHGVYTPQIVVDGVDTMLNLMPANVAELIRRHQDGAAKVAISTQRQDGRLIIEIDPVGTGGMPAAVELVRYLPARDVVIGGGENSGRSMRYVNIVVSLETIAQWDGVTPIRVSIAPPAKGAAAPEDDARRALLVQQYRRGTLPGQIVAALALD